MESASWLFHEDVVLLQMGHVSNEGCDNSGENGARLFFIFFFQRRTRNLLVNDLLVHIVE